MFDSEDKMQALSSIFNLRTEEIGSFYTSLLKRYGMEESYNQFSEELNRKQWRISDTPISNRTLTHWLKEGVLIDSRTDNKGWSSFSTLELSWISVVKRLRSYGYSLQHLRSVTKSISQFQDVSHSPYPVLELGLYKCSQFRLHVLLVVNEYGECLLIDNMPFSMDSWIHPNINQFTSFLAVQLQDIFKEANRGIIAMEEDEISKAKFEEFSKEVSLKGIKEVRILFNDAGPYQMEIEQRNTDKKELHQLIDEFPYQDITLKINDKRVDSVVRVVKSRVTPKR